jgi:cytoskeletal protein CcmA (bactofilin family)
MFKSSSSNTNPGKTKKSPGNGNASLAPTNSLVNGAKVEGSIFTENDIRIDGALVGTLNCKGKVIVGPSGEIEGEIHCANAVIEGKFNGMLFVTESLHVKESARIEGDVNTAKLIVQSGAIFDVSCKMSGQSGGKKQSPKDSSQKAFELGELSKAVNQ